MICYFLVDNKNTSCINKDNRNRVKNYDQNLK